MAPASHSALKNIPKRLRTTSGPGAFYGDVVYDPGGTCGPRVQQDFQLVVLIEGYVIGDVAGRERRLEAGEVGLFLPGFREYFRFSTEARTHHTWCSVCPELVDDALASACAQAPEKMPVTRRFEQLMEMGLSLPLDAGTRAHGLVESLGLAALQEYLFAGERARHGQREEPDALRRALEWIALEGHGDVNLRTLAKEAGVSPAQLVKLFRTYLGTTPIRHVWETRTRRGVQLLRETGLTVGEIAYRCGFQTPFHFSRWAKEMFGASPRELRSKAWTASA